MAQLATFPEILCPIHQISQLCPLNSSVPHSSQLHRDEWVSKISYETQRAAQHIAQPFRFSFSQQAAHIVCLGRSNKTPDRLLPPAIVIMSPAPAVVDLPHPLVIPAPEPFAIFMRSPPGKIRIAILVTVVHIRPAVIPKVAISPSCAVIEPAPFPRLFSLVALVTPLRLSVVLLSLRALRDSK
jgi:hypothetical protein